MMLPTNAARFGSLLAQAMYLEAIEMDVDPGNTALTAIRARTGRHRAPGRLARCVARLSKKPSAAVTAEGPNQLPRATP